MTDLYLRSLKSILRTLDALKASLDKHTEAIREHEKPHPHEGEPHPKQVVDPVVGLPPAITDYYSAEQQERPRKNRWEEIRRAVEIGGLLTALSLAFLTYVTLRKVSSQADSAQRQVQIMQRQLETTDRPWIQIISANVNDMLALYPGKTRPPTGYVSIKMVVKNVGRSAAVDVRMTGRLIFELAENALRDRQRSICLADDPLNTTAEFTLFPNEDSGDRLMGQIGTGGYEPIPPEAITPMASGKLMTNPIFTGCITYEFGGSVRPHHTGFLYMFAVKYPNGITRPDRLFEIGERIPADQLVMAEDPAGFSNVD